MLGEPAGRADGALILLTLTAYPAGVYDSLSRDGSFAADLPADLAAFMADAQVPWSVGALGGAVTDPAWRAKPSWYLVATEDRMIPPPAQPASVGTQIRQFGRGATGHGSDQDAAHIGGSGAWLLFGWLTRCECVSGRASASFKSWDACMHRAS